jgi:hypothetical protein
VKAAEAGALLGQDGKLTSLALRIADKIEEIAEAYNFDHGDDMADYFHNNFYLTVTVLDRPVPHKNWRKEE